METKRYILTGAPGAGKTTLIRQLETLGYFVVEEAATAVIALGQAQGVPEPWNNPGFIDQIMALQKQRQIQTASLPLEWQFFDRSPLDTYALSVYSSLPVSAALSDEIERIEKERIYQKIVFFIANLGFCEPTAARKISFEDSLRFEAIHEEVYKSRNYDCIKIAAKTVQERVEDILSVLPQGHLS